MAHCNFTYSIYVLFSVIVIIKCSLVNTNFGDRFVCEGAGQSLSRNNLCQNADAKNIKITKSAESEFKSCPNTAQICFERDTYMFLYDNSRFYVQQNCQLSAKSGTQFRISGKSLINIFSNSSFLNDKSAQLTIVNSALRVYDNSVLSNKGNIFIQNNSIVSVNSFSKLMYENAGIFTLAIKEASRVNISDFSDVIINEGSIITVGIRTIFEVKDHSKIRFIHSHLQMKEKSKIKLTRSATLTIGSSLCASPWATTGLTLGENSALIVQNTSITLDVGQIVLLKNAELELGSSSKKHSIHVHGLLVIDTKNISHIKELIVGYDPNDNTKNCSIESTLVIKHSGAIPPSLKVKRGAHCYTKAAGRERNPPKELNADTNTNSFKCFDKRYKLVQALNWTTSDPDVALIVEQSNIDQPT